jgi:hypothetical protein
MAHTVVEAEKSHDLPPENWRAKKAGRIGQFQSESPRTRGHSGRNGINLRLISGEDGMRCPSSSNETWNKG